MSLPCDAFDLEPEEARDRFAWAVRQGNPFWLWPDLPVEDWRAALDAIERATREVLAGRRAGQPLAGDPAAFCVAGYTSGMGPLLGYWIEQDSIAAEPGIAESFELHLRHNRPRMAMLARRTSELAEAFAARRVGTTVLKGMHTAWAFFPDPATRPMSDIDLLIDAADEAAAGEALAAKGFEPIGGCPVPRQRTWRHRSAPCEPRSLAFVHAEDPWTVDAQVSLNRRHGVGSPVVRLDDAYNPTESEPSPLSPYARSLPPALLALQLACHASCGLENLTLLRLVELVLVIRRSALAWDEFLVLAERSRSHAHAYPALRMCDELAPGAVPQTVLRSCERQVPPAVRRIIDGLTPASAQNLLRCSLGEKLMWTRSPLALVRQIAQVLVPPGMAAPAALLDIYRKRLWRLRHGTLTR